MTHIVDPVPPPARFGSDLTYCGLATNTKAALPFCGPRRLDLVPPDRHAYCPRCLEGYHAAYVRPGPPPALDPHLDVLAILLGADGAT